MSQRSQRRKKRKRKNTQNKSKTHEDFGEKHHTTVSVFSHCQLQMYFSGIDPGDASVVWFKLFLFLLSTAAGTNPEGAKCLGRGY